MTLTPEDFKALLEAFATWTAGTPTITDWTEDEPDFVNDNGVTAAKGYVRILEGIQNNAIYKGGHRDDLWRIMVQLSFDNGVGTLVKMEAFINNIRAAVDADRKTGGRTHRYKVLPQKYTDLIGIVIIDAVKELTVF